MSFGSEPYFKLLLLGDHGVGKTTVLGRIQEDPSSGRPDYATDYKIKTWDVEGRSIKTQIWDTAGQEKFRTITGSYYRGAKGVLLLVSCTDIESFTSAEQWLSDIERYAMEEMTIILIANKIDLAEKRVVQTSAMKDWADQHGTLFIEISAIDPSLDIDSVIKPLVSSIYQRQRGDGRSSTPVGTETIHLKKRRGTTVKKPANKCMLL